MRKNLYIVIVGCGRLGSTLANRLSRAGHSVVVIDANEAAFNDLSPDYSGFRIVGDATQLAVLKEARLDKANVFLATAREDNVNLMVAQIARKLFQVGHVLVRVFDPRREQIYKHHDIETICPTSVIAELLMSTIAAGQAVSGEAAP
jgi:trk system potassium uptake protein